MWVWAGEENSKQGNAVNSFQKETGREKIYYMSVFLLPLFTKNPREIRKSGNWWTDATDVYRDDLADMNVLRFETLICR